MHPQFIILFKDKKFDQILKSGHLLRGGHSLLQLPYIIISIINEPTSQPFYKSWYISI